MFRRLTQDEFDVEFTLVPAPSGGDDWWDNPDDIKTLEFRTALNEGRVWTEVDAEDDEDGNMVFLTFSGFHPVNRLRHYVTEESHNGDDIEVVDVMERWDNNRPIPWTEAYDRLEYIRSQIEEGSISYGEIAELQDLVDYIDPSDVQLLEWAGVSEFPEGEAD